jgi:hypothetical protein
MPVNGHTVGCLHRAPGRRSAQQGRKPWRGCERHSLGSVGAPCRDPVRHLPVPSEQLHRGRQGAGSDGLHEHEAQRGGGKHHSVGRVTERDGT